MSARRRAAEVGLVLLACVFFALAVVGTFMGFWLSVAIDTVVGVAAVVIYAVIRR